MPSVLNVVLTLLIVGAWAEASFSDEKNAFVLTRHDPADVEHLSQPIGDVPEDVSKAIDRINRVINLAHNNDTQGLAALALEFAAVIKDPAKPKLHPAVDVKFTFKGGSLAHLDCDVHNVAKFRVNFRNDGRVSSYEEYTAKSDRSVIFEFHDNGYPMNMRTLSKDGRLLDLQLDWDKSGKETKRVDEKSPREFELQQGR
jgi:hypothetical protein